MNTALLLITPDSKQGKQLKSMLTNEGVLVNLITSEEQLRSMSTASYGLVVVYDDTYEWDLPSYLSSGILAPIPKMVIRSNQSGSSFNGIQFIEELEVGNPCHAVSGRILTFFQIPHESVLCAKDLILHPSSRIVERGGQSIKLTNKEFQLLQLLLEKKGKVVSKEEISREIWNINFETGTNTIEVYINFLRNKIDKPFGSKLIYTKSGFGYIIKEYAE